MNILLLGKNGQVGHALEASLPASLTALGRLVAWDRSQADLENPAALEAALKLAEKVARQSPSSVKVCKQLVQRARIEPPGYNLIHEREQFIKLFDTSRAG